MHGAICVLAPWCVPHPHFHLEVVPCHVLLSELGLNDPLSQRCHFSLCVFSSSTCLEWHEGVLRLLQWHWGLCRLQEPPLSKMLAGVNPALNLPRHCPTSWYPELAKTKPGTAPVMGHTTCYIILFGILSVRSEKQFSYLTLTEILKGLIFCYAEEPKQVIEESLSTTVRAERQHSHSQVWGQEAGPTIYFIYLFIF